MINPTDRSARKAPGLSTSIAASANGTMTIRSGPWKLITELGSGGFTKPSRVAATPSGPDGQLDNLADIVQHLAQAPEKGTRFCHEQCRRCSLA